MFFGFDRLLDLVVYHPKVDVCRVRKVMNMMNSFMLALNSSKTPKYKSTPYSILKLVDLMEPYIVRWHYLVVFMQ